MYTHIFNEETELEIIYIKNTMPISSYNFFFYEINYIFVDGSQSFKKIKN